MTPPNSPPTLSAVFAKLALFIVPAFLLLPLSSFLPAIDLTGFPALLAYGFSEAGGQRGLPVVVLIMVGILVSRPDAKRVRELGLMVLVLGAILGGSAYINEHITKPKFAVPRPNIQELSNVGVLGMSPEEFYKLPTKHARSERLKGILGQAKAEKIALHPIIRAHWIEETGFSFPSGHSLAAMLFATFFLAYGFAVASGWRSYLCMALVPWAVGVCFSRPILRVHSPTDITCGGLMGVVLASVGFVIMYKLAGFGEASPNMEKSEVSS